MDPDDNGFVPSQSLKQILVDLDMVDLANDETTLARLRGRYCYPTLVSRIYPTMPHTLLIHDDETTLARLRGRYYYLLYIAFIQNHPIIAMHAYLLASRYPLRWRDHPVEFVMGEPQPIDGQRKHRRFPHRRKRARTRDRARTRVCCDSIILVIVFIVSGHGFDRGQ